MHALSLTLALQAIVGLAAGAALSIPARDASPVSNSDLAHRHPEPAPAPDTHPVFTPLTLRDEHLADRTNTTPKPVKRPVYNGTAAGGDDNYCGESAVVTESWGDDKPLASDCRVIASRYTDPVRGFWTIYPSDIAAAPADGFVTLDTYGTCAFKVRLNFPTPAIAYRFGSNDIRFYITVYSRNEKNGHYSGESGVLCNWQRVMTGVTWAIVRP